MDPFGIHGTQVKNPWLTWTSRTDRCCRIKWRPLDEDVRNTLAHCVSSLFGDLPECAADEEKEWRLFKAAAISPMW